MAKNAKSLRQQRQEQKLQRAAAPRPAPGLTFQQPLFCQPDALVDLCAHFYRCCGADLLVGIPGCLLTNLPQKAIPVPTGMEAALLGVQLSQLYAVCFNASLENAVLEYPPRPGDPKKPPTVPGSLEILLPLADPTQREIFRHFLLFVNLARQFFCHHAYYWPQTNPGQGVKPLVNYLVIHEEKQEDPKPLTVLQLRHTMAGQNDWHCLQLAVLQMADDLYHWLWKIADLHSKDAPDEGWKKALRDLYMPSLQAWDNWYHPIAWQWAGALHHLREGTTCRTPHFTSTLTDEIMKREDGIPHPDAPFVPLQDQIYAWANTIIEMTLRSATTPVSSSGRITRRT